MNGPLFTLDVIGAFILFGAILALIAGYLIELRHRSEGAAMFGTNGRHATQPAAALLPLPPERPFPGDEPREATPAFLPAPVPEPAPKPDYVLAAIGHDGDTDECVTSMWNRIQARQLMELLRAEEEAESSG